MQQTVKIGNAISFKRPDSWEFNEDDRLEQIKIIGGTYIQDNGCFNYNIKATVIFTPIEYVKLKTHRDNREKVVVFDEHIRQQDGTYLIKIISKKYVTRFDYFEVQLELLRC